MKYKVSTYNYQNWCLSSYKESKIAIILKLLSTSITFISYAELTISSILAINYDND